MRAHSGVLWRAPDDSLRDPDLRDPRFTCACAAAITVLVAAPARADSAMSVAMATGQYGMRKEIPHSLEFGLEVRPPWTWGPLRPIAGVLGSGSGALVYSGIALGIDLPARLQLTPSFAPALALAGADRDLGFPLEFRSSLELSVATGDRVRLGLAFSHISNAKLGDRNPGVEVLALTVAISAPRSAESLQSAARAW